MNPEDKEFARRMLESKRLTIEQVEEIRAEAGRTGRSFRELAEARSPAPPARASGWVSLSETPLTPRGLIWKALAELKNGTRFPPLYAALLGASFLIFAGLLIATVVKLRERSAKDDDLALETERSRAETERLSSEARRGYERTVVSSRETAAKEQLQKARAAMKIVEDKLRAGPPDSAVALLLDEAFVGYNMYLDVLPDDVDVRLERARTHELRRNYDKAIVDLERVIDLRRDLAPGLQDKVIQLRLLLPKSPR